MRYFGRGMGLCLAMVAGLCIARPAHAQFTISQTPVNTAQTVQLIQEVQNRGYFRCPGALTLIQLLNNAQATSDPGQRYLIRQQAFLCCSELSRELRSVAASIHVGLTGEEIDVVVLGTGGSCEDRGHENEDSETHG